ncbi:lantibiotic dehydratase [Actinocrispum sp. NPDC049592]|uniref:lantibiotic dehydratase n=1 Tax=Actinocrispum sp. NPDC049592 TaxID=3154835 RepID=UPI0034448A9F
MDLSGGRVDATHVVLPSGKWAVWKPLLLRASGFPASGVSRLTAPELARQADTVAEESPGSPGYAAYQQAFDAEMARLSGELQAIVREPGFRLALTWQNHRVIDTGLNPFLRRRPGIDKRNSQYRQHEDLLANYWQRYCVKNDAIGFFGPVGWGHLDAGTATSEVRAGPGLIASSEVFFETWAVDELAARVEATGGLRKWLCPRILPFVRIEDEHLRVPGVRPVPLKPEELAVLGSCDGRTPAWQVVKSVVDTVAGLSVEDAYAVIERLCRRRVLAWRIDVPVSLRPERDLRRVLSELGDPTVAAEGRAKLDRLEAARDEVRLAADDPAALLGALTDLDATFRELTGAAPTRNQGKTYGGRTLVYHDALRDVRPLLGRDFLEALRPIELLLGSIRWFTHQVGQKLRSALGELVDEYVAGHGHMPTLAWIWMNAMPLVHGPEARMAEDVCAELHRRWESILDCPVDGARVRYDQEQLADKVAELFDAPGPGWSGARYCSPDIMISASSREAFERGEFTLVLGEFHVAVNTLRSAFQVEQHPCPQELWACLAAETPGPRLHPVLPKENAGRLSARTHPALTLDRDFLVTLFDHTVDPARSRVLRAADLEVERSAGRLWVTAPGEYRFDVLDVFAEMLMNLVGDRFGIFGVLPHTPRVTIGKVVITRESWMFGPDQLSFATAKNEATRFAQARQWARANRMPREVFVKAAKQKKPFYVDFDSPVYVNLFAKAVRAARSAPDQVPVQITEMLPATADLWLTGGPAERYTSELRLAVFDLAEA